MPQAYWTPVAESDLDDFLFYIALEDRRPETAIRVYFEIRDRVIEQATRQLPGQRHPNAPNEWLYFKYKRWLVFYQPHPQGIEIMRIVDDSRDMPTALP